MSTLTWPPSEHCPFDHEHPQPFVRNGSRYCGCCWFMHDTLTEMVAGETNPEQITPEDIAETDFHWPWGQP